MEKEAVDNIYEFPIERISIEPRISSYHRQGWAEVLLELSNELSNCMSHDAVFLKIQQHLRQLLDAESVLLLMMNSQSKELYTTIDDGKYTRRMTITESDSVAWDVCAKKEPILLNENVGEEPLLVSESPGVVGKEIRSLVCVPILAGDGEAYAALMAINSRKGAFTRMCQYKLSSIAKAISSVVYSIFVVAKADDSHARELDFMNAVSTITSELNLQRLLIRVMSEASKMLNAERSTLFLNDGRAGQLFSVVSEGLNHQEIRIPNTEGIAGLVFTTGKSVMIEHAYSDLRFNPSLDQDTGYFTRNILCCPIINNKGETIGVTQVLNRHEGMFTANDEAKLIALCSQISMALENAQLFNDVQKSKDFNDAVLQSMSNGVVTIDVSGNITYCNRAGIRLLHIHREHEIVDRNIKDVFVGKKAFLIDSIKQVTDSGNPVNLVDVSQLRDGNDMSVNVSILPLMNLNHEMLGVVVSLEDFTSEKRIKTTLARYMDPVIVNELVEKGQKELEGKLLQSTVLISDIRGFTSISERLGAQQTVALLNEYFELMVDEIRKEEGVLDKFIGDSIMAVFGLPHPESDDVERAVRAAIQMLQVLSDWNRVQEQKNQQTLEIGIGINTDNIVAGNIGSEKHSNYTVIGDGVNVCSRVESITKYYGTTLLVTENTYKRLLVPYRSRMVDCVRIVGRNEPVILYEIMEHMNESNYPFLSDALRHYKQAHQYYLDRKWKEAHKGFTQVLRMNAEDKLSRLYKERCEEFIKTPPSAEWDMVWDHVSK